MPFAITLNRDNGFSAPMNVIVLTGARQRFYRVLLLE